MGCQAGYWLNNTKCQIECSSEGEYWYQSTNVCNDCHIDCLRCQNNTRKCLECKQGLHLYEDLHLCWYPQETIQKYDVETTPVLLDVYYDPYSPSINFLFDREVREDNIQRKLLKLKFELIEKTKNVSLKAGEEKYEGTKKINKIVFPSDEINNGTLRISTLVEGVSELLTKSKISQNSQSGMNRLLEGDRIDPNQGGKRGQSQLASSTKLTKRAKTTTTLEKNHQKEQKISQKGPELIFFSFTIKKINFYKSKDATLISIIGLIIKISSIGITITSILFYPPGAISIIRFTQIFSLLRMLNNDLPANLMTLLNELSLNALSLFPNPFKNIEIVSTCYPAHVYYRIGDFSCSILKRQLPALVVLLAVLVALKAILRGLLVVYVKYLINEKLDPNHLSGFQKRMMERDFILRWLIKLNLFISRRLILYYLLAAYMDVVKDSLVAIKYPGDGKEKNRDTNLTLGIISIGAYALLLFRLIFVYCKEGRMKTNDLLEYRRNKKEGIQLKSYCYGEFADEETAPLLAHVISLIVDGGLCGTLILASESGGIQLYATLGVVIFFLLFLISNKSFSSNGNQGLMIARFGILLLFLAGMIAQNFFNLSQKIVHDSIGNLTVGFICLLFISRLFFEVTVLISVIWKPKTDPKKQRMMKFTRILTSLSLKNVDFRWKMSTFNEDQNDQIPEEAEEGRGTGMTLNSRMNRLSTTKFKKRVTTKYKSYFDVEYVPPNSQQSQTLSRAESTKKILDHTRETRLQKSKIQRVERGGGGGQDGDS